MVLENLTGSVINNPEFCDFIAKYVRSLGAKKWKKDCEILLEKKTKSEKEECKS